MILFETEPDIAAFVETNLIPKEKLAVSGYTRIGKNRQHKERGGVDCFINKTVSKILALLSQTTIQLRKY